MNSFVFTCGDVNGIGPEIVIKTINKIAPIKNQKIIFICPKNVFFNVISSIPIKFQYEISKSFNSFTAKSNVNILDIGYCKVATGKVTKSSGKTSYNSIMKACNLSSEGLVDAIITAPISKLAFKKAGIQFPGHTELFAEYFGVKKYAMMFISNKLKAALATIHIPINKISKELTQEKLKSVIELISLSLQKDFLIYNPKLAVLGLNPHSGENGKIGSEELNIIKPVINKISAKIDGPMVPDAYFGNKLYNNYDCTIGMYHDQILIPFKLLNFNKGVNFTAGLPIVRTSPDHGTAFDIAGKGIAKENSMIEAFKYAKIITRNRKSNDIR